jgi:hypothetical protein
VDGIVGQVTAGITGSTWTFRFTRRSIQRRLDQQANERCSRQALFGWRAARASFGVLAAELGR